MGACICTPADDSQAHQHSTGHKQHTQHKSQHHTHTPHTTHQSHNNVDREDQRARVAAATEARLQKQQIHKAGKKPMKTELYPGLQEEEEHKSPHSPGERQKTDWEKRNEDGLGATIIYTRS